MVKSHRNKKFNHIKASLKERIKELECLYNILQISVEKQNFSLNEIVQDIVNILPQAWQYPKITSARIILDREEYRSIPYRVPLYTQESEILIKGKNRGRIEISYFRESPILDEGPFLKEERSLINNVARKLALIVISFEERKEREILESKLIHADRLATVGEFTAGIAHELNEPIGSILGFAQLIKKDAAAYAHIKNDLDKIINASIHAREVIRKVMTFSRYNEKGSEKICLNNILTDGIYLLESRCKKENIEIVKTLGRELTSCVCQCGSVKPDCGESMC
jgi:signal transduction histidine kinase